MARDAAGVALPASDRGNGIAWLSVRNCRPAPGAEYSSYCGNYTFDGARLVTWVDSASDPSRIGSDQVRGVRFENSRMILSPPRRTGGHEEYREIFWERIGRGIAGVRVTTKAERR